MGIKKRKKLLGFKLEFSEALVARWIFLPEASSMKKEKLDIER